MEQAVLLRNCIHYPILKHKTPESTKMKKTILMISLILICLLLGGAGYRFYLSQYEEECLNYSWIRINRTAEECQIFTTYINITKDGLWDVVCDEENKINVTREVLTTDKCIKYYLVRNIKI